jgi:hypothetical protein
MPSKKGKRKIGRVKRRKGTFVYVDAQGNVWEMERPKRKKTRTK